MKKIIVALFVMAFAIAGAQLVNLQNVTADQCPGGNLCTTVDVQTDSGAIGSTTNSKTLIGTCQLVTGKSSGTAYWAIQQYASVSSGPIVRGHIYALTATDGVVSVDIDDVFPNGAYGKSLTGPVGSTCHNSK
jgi:hypothetical protein